VIGDPAVRVGAHAACDARARPVPADAGATELTVAGDADARPAVLAELAQSTLDTLRRAVSELGALEVTTYAGDYEGARAAATGDAGGHARRRAYTRCKIDGDTIVNVPVDERGAVDVELWRIHEGALTQARQQRAEMLRLILSLVPGLAP